MNEIKDILFTIKSTCEDIIHFEKVYNIKLDSLKLSTIDLLLDILQIHCCASEISNTDHLIEDLANSNIEDYDMILSKYFNK